MLDNKDIESIGSLLKAQKQEIAADMDAKLKAQKQEIAADIDTKLKAQKREIAADMDTKLKAQKQEIAADMDAKLKDQKQEIATDMDAKLKAQKQEIATDLDAKLKDQKQDLVHQFMVIVESEINPKLNALAEGQQTLLETLAPKSRVEALEEEVSFLKSVLKLHTEEIDRLKKAQ